MLYDLGPVFISGFSATEAVVKPNLIGMGIGELDKVIVSHQDSDHKGDAKVIAKFFQHDEDFTCPSKMGRWQHLTIHRLWPPHGDIGETEDNDKSCVLKLVDDISGKSILLTGDISRSVELKLVNRHHNNEIELTADVLFSPHHGSKYSSSYPFLKAVESSYLIHTAGVFNHFNFPAKEVRQRAENLGIEQYSTSTSGQIIVKFGQNMSPLVIESLLDKLSPFWKKQNPFSFQVEIR